ncbi:ATP-NAD kinase family protein [Reinekea blandensis]|uniref:ATP-NAD kinase n=1 Tax=Reinekea blandensis MED297 TaxID=314283 RepID=A4BCA6_9GAMM|nr:ATP-NAD kinase family protein [Reinekea blandensis]EAR10172.1 hypothetical protein MED297_13152 [Reinekea sp. MED297] [Reinekea blandensis MED297]
MKIGLIINPWAGVGGSVALKGSDGPEIRNEALKRGAQPKANDKTAITLQELHARSPDASIHWYSAPGKMGEEAIRNEYGANLSLVVQPDALPEQTEASETYRAAEWLLAQSVDLILFAGGDGTARNLLDVVGERIPVLGIPAGVKIHSGVFAVTPHAAGDVLAGLLNGDITELHQEEVRDIDEEAFRSDRVVARYYGDMKVPVSGEFMQHVKVGGLESQDLVLNDIADWFIETMQDDVCYFIGSGKSTATIMDALHLPNTLLGIDAVYQGQVVKADCSEADLLSLLSQYPCRALISIIGGQGHIFGRGNAQFSPQVLAQLTRENIDIIGTKTKLKSLEGRPLLIDSSDPALDRAWAGLMPVMTGYHDHVIYPVVAR